MYSFLAQPNAIAHLDLSNTECSLDMVIFFFILLKGSQNSYLDGKQWAFSAIKYSLSLRDI